MVGIDKVKVSCNSMSLAHVSHFFSEKGPWTKRGWTHFAVFPRFVNSQSPALPLSLARASPFQHLFDAFSASFGTWMPLRVATGKRFGHVDAVSAPFRHLDAISGNYREALWPLGYGFGALSAPGYHFARTFANAAAFGQLPIALARAVPETFFV